MKTLTYIVLIAAFISLSTIFLNSVNKHTETIINKIVERHSVYEDLIK